MVPAVGEPGEDRERAAWQAAKAKWRRVAVVTMAARVVLCVGFVAAICVLVSGRFKVPWFIGVSMLASIAIIFVNTDTSLQSVSHSYRPNDGLWSERVRRARARERS